MADAEDFAKCTQANLRFYKTRNGYELDPLSTYHWLRKSIAENLRTGNFWQVNLLLGGYEEQSSPQLIDHLGNVIPDQNFLFSGMGGRYCYAILDSLYKNDMSEAERLDALNKCLVEIKKRSMVSQNKFSVIIIGKDGARHFDDIKF